MIIFEDTDRALTNHIPWHLPDGIRSHLESVKDDNKKDKLTKNPTTKEAWDHLNDILSMDDNRGINVKEMKRMKNWFEHHTNATKTKQYELYGGDVMMNWVNNQLTSARRTIKQQKEAEKAMGKKNAFKKEHSTDRQTKVTKVDDKTPTYNPATQNKQKRLKELSALQETKTIILTEKQRLLTEAINPELFKSDFFDKVSHAFWNYSGQDYYTFLDDYVKSVLGAPIGSGSSRVVYQIDDNIIVKIAMNDLGFKQNAVECNAYDKTTQYKELFVKVYSHTKDCVCAIMEYSVILDEIDADDAIHSITGAKNFDEFSLVMDRIAYYKTNGESKEEVITHIIKDLRANPTKNLQLLIAYMYDNPKLLDEVISKSNMGIAKRGNETWLIIIDNGYDGEIAREYYDDSANFGKLNL